VGLALVQAIQPGPTVELLGMSAALRWRIMSTKQ